MEEAGMKMKRKGAVNKRGKEQIGRWRQKEHGPIGGDAYNGLYDARFGIHAGEDPGRN